MEMPARADRVVRPYGMESKGEDAVEVVGACTGGQSRPPLRGEIRWRGAQEGGKTSGIVFPARERTGNRVADTLFNTRARAYFWSLVRT